MQSAHAAVEYAARCPGVAGCTLVMLAVPDEPSLFLAAAMLDLHGVDTELFREPDLGNQLTAIAAAGPQAERRLRRLHLLLREEVSMEENMAWLQSKVAAQRKALDELHSRVVNQRFQLRVINEKGRGLTRAEFAEARDAIENEQTRERIGDPV